MKLSIDTLMETKMKQEESRIKAPSGSSHQSRFLRNIQIERFLSQSLHSRFDWFKAFFFDNLKEDIKSVVMGKPGLENREKSI